MDENIASPAPEVQKQTSRERLKEITDSIEVGIKELFESDRFKEYLRVMGKFHKYSLNNTVLIHMQRPDATRVAGFTRWKEQFNRDVKRGERGIRIIAPTFYWKTVEEMKVDPETNAPMVDHNGEIIMEEKEVKIPMFKVVTVFDVAQTRGAPLPQLASDLTGDVQQYEIFMEALKRSSPVPMTIKPLADNLDGYFNLKDQSISLREGMSEVQTVCAAVHEISHAKLHNRLANADLEYQKGELFGRPVLFTKSKIDKEKLPIGLNSYDLRSLPPEKDTPALLEKKVLSNFAGTIITDMSLTIPERGFINIKDELAVTNEKVTLRDYYSEVRPEMANKSERTQEIEAESIAYAVCAYYGIETSENSFGYIASWSSDKDLKELKASLETINKTASGLISDIDKNFDLICKERGIDRSTQIEPIPQEALFLLADSTYIHVQRQALSANFDYSDPLIDSPFIDVAEAISESFGIAHDKIEVIDLAKLHEIESANIAATPAEIMPEPEPLRDLSSLDEYPMPSQELGTDVFVSMGYTQDDILPITREQAHELMDKDFSIFFVSYTLEPEMCLDHQDIDGITELNDTGFGILRDEWEASDMFKERLAERLEHQTERETAFQAFPDNCYAIYQLNHSAEAMERAFLPFDRLETDGLTVDKSMYDLIYTGSMPEMGSRNEVLENLFYKFNEERPKDFAGHSMSVSDIVAVKQDGVISCHYCDSIGFKEVQAFMEDNPLKNAEMSLEDDFNMVDGIINNGPKQPTVEELERQAKSGQPISLMDLADAVQREKATSAEEIKPKRMSIYEQLRQPLPQQPKKDKAPKAKGGPEL